MALKERSKTLLSFALHFSVSICLCAVATLPLPQLSASNWTETCEAECPAHENGESFEEELVVAASARRREQLHYRIGRLSRRPGRGLRRVISSVSQPRAIVGHQIANGLRAPLLI